MSFQGVETVDLAVFGIYDIWHALGEAESDSFDSLAVFAVVLVLLIFLPVFLSGWSATFTYGVYKWQKHQDSKERSDCFGSSVALCTVQTTSGAVAN